ncbi:hypothetical protein EYB25_003951 [Talaromyces marneffei]|nr:hypothetical protein EYB25_003951 [Talaromyces marneffei]
MSSSQVIKDLSSQPVAVESRLSKRQDHTETSPLTQEPHQQRHSSQAHFNKSHIMARHLQIHGQNSDMLSSLITTLDHLKNASVTRHRETINMRNCVSLTHFIVSPIRANYFLANQPCISPVDYDAVMQHIILYPPPCQVQTQLIKIFDTWLSQVARILSTTTKKEYRTWHASQWALSGRWHGCNYFARLALHEVGAYSSVILETIHVDRANEREGNFESEYIYEKAARWVEGSNGAVRLVTIALISQDPLIPWTSPLLPGWNPASRSHDWGISPNQIIHSSIDTIATNITSQDKTSSARIGVDLYFATASCPNHRGYAEHVWNGVFCANGHLLPADWNSVASNFALSQIFSEATTTSHQGTAALDELRISVNDLRTTLPRAVTMDRFAQAEFIARDAQQVVKQWRAQGLPTV